MFNLLYRLLFRDEFNITNLLKPKSKKNMELPKLSLQKPGLLKEQKVKHLREALKFMQDERDVAFYKAVLKM